MADRFSCFIAHLSRREDAPSSSSTKAAKMWQIFIGELRSTISYIESLLYDNDVDNNVIE